MILTHSLSALALLGTLASPAVCQPTSPKILKRAVNGPYIATKSPRVNVFQGLSTEEKTSVSDFVEKQKGVTIPGDVFFGGAWAPNIWLLAPNKTAATSYLDGAGSQPGRYARVLGTKRNCYNQEFMVGPLPVDGSTKVIPLDYVHGGNSTKENGSWCFRDDGSARPQFDEPAPTHRVNFTTPARTATATATPTPSTARLQARYPQNPYNEKLGWDGKALPHDEKMPPVAILPDGARHEFDPEQNYVSWMDFTFMVSTGVAGISLHDVRFKGQRIIYELGMQEALAHYAGPDRSQPSASYLDVSVGFENYNLIPGFDCPTYATFTDAFCLFEFQKDFPMNRHHNFEYTHATKNVAFLVRSVSTVGNYDYQTTYEFHYDGSIDVIVRASGYIQGSTEVGDDAWDYGYHVREELSGSMHDHVLNFKLDLDVLGTKNSLVKTEFVPHSQVYPWSDGKVYNTMKVERSFIKNENQGKIHWAPNAAASYAVVNTERKNELGEYPGFRVYPSLGASIHSTVQNSSKFFEAINWATHPMYALQRKDAEPVSAHPINALYPQKPFVNFNDFFNGESLDQEDLVLYFNLGMHHMPDTYDLPNTVFTGSQSGMSIRPQNYLPKENSMGTRQQIHITNENGQRKIETYGAKQPSGSFDLASVDPTRLQRQEN